MNYELHQIPGGLAQLARAPALHAGGQRFESVILHFGKSCCCLVVKLFSCLVVCKYRPTSRQQNNETTRQQISKRSLTY